MNAFMDRLRRFDAYPKTADDFKIKTFSGATITIISSIIIFLLFASELNSFLSPDLMEELFVDTSRGSKLKINLDIVFPAISCDYLALDAMDNSGEQHLQIEHNIYKTRLNLDGHVIDEPKKEDITIKTTTVKSADNTSSEVQCGSCYGAADRCCNTCDDVREAYRLKGWAMTNLNDYVQCKGEAEKRQSTSAFDEGCQIHGYMEVNRVSGSFHIAPGKSFSINHVHVHDVQPYSSSAFNTTHRIRHLSFGTSVLGEKSSPLDGEVGFTEEGATMFQYYFKIVPTLYVRRDGSKLSSYQFSVTRHQKSISILSGETGMPGSFFNYELSPLMVKYTEKERSFGHFATSVCAIIGGVFTAAGILDTFFYHSVKAMEKKIQLEKAI